MSSVAVDGTIDVIRGGSFTGITSIVKNCEMGISTPNIGSSLSQTYNATKPESRAPITEEGLSRFFEAAVMSSVGKGRDTRVFSFQPIFASKPVVKLFNDNFKQIFDFIDVKPTETDLANWFNSSFQVKRGGNENEVRLNDPFHLAYLNEIHS